MPTWFLLLLQFAVDLVDQGGTMAIAGAPGGATNLSMASMSAGKATGSLSVGAAAAAFSGSTVVSGPALNTTEGGPFTYDARHQ
jgi:hypothetical protein